MASSFSLSLKNRPDVAQTTWIKNSERFLLKDFKPWNTKLPREAVRFLFLATFKVISFRVGLYVM